VASNLGVSFLPRFAVERELSSGELQELPFSPTPLVITALCAHHASKFVSPAMRVFMECVQTCLTEEASPAANAAAHGDQDARRLMTT